MKDIDGKDLKVGDIVLYAGSSRYLNRYQISRFTPRGVRVNMVINGIVSKYGQLSLCPGDEMYKLNESVDS